MSKRIKTGVKHLDDLPGGPTEDGGWKMDDGGQSNYETDGRDPRLSDTDEDLDDANKT